MKKNCVNIQSIPVSLAESFTIVFEAWNVYRVYL